MVNKDNSTKIPLLLSIPFIGAHSLHLKSKISRLIIKCYPGCHFRNIFSSPIRISQFFHFKNILPTPLHSSVIYHYTCLCCNARYYGKTTSNLVLHYMEHMGITKTGSATNNNNSSAVYYHLLPLVNPFLVIIFDIISHINNSVDLLIHENLVTIRDHPILNAQMLSFPFTLF